MTTYRYRIRDWDEHFETATSRKLRRPQWVSIPTQQSGKGFTRIMVQEDGAAIFGLWILLIEACSAQPTPRAGWLTDDGTAAGVPWTIDDLSERWRRKPAEVARALDVLCSPKVGWIEQIDDDGQIAQDGGRNAQETQVVKSGQVVSGQGWSSAPPPVPSPEEARAENRRSVRTRLARLRLASDDTALEEWCGLLALEAKCTSLGECLDCLSWLKFHGPREGVTSRYATHYELLARRWADRQRKMAQKVEAAP